MEMIVKEEGQEVFKSDSEVPELDRCTFTETGNPRKELDWKKLRGSRERALVPTLRWKYF